MMEIPPGNHLWLAEIILPDGEKDTDQLTMATINNPLITFSVEGSEFWSCD